jgi:hypothetical protein
MSKLKIIEAKIKKVRWFTDRRGHLQPVMILTKKLPSGYDSLALPLPDVCRLQVGIGSVLRLTKESEHESAYDVKSSYRCRPLDIPNTCPSCEGPLNERGPNELICLNYGCPAHGRTPIRKLFRALTDLPAFADIYADCFPVTFERTVYLDDFSDFLYQIKTVGGVGTSARHAIIEKHLGDFLNGFGRTSQDLVNWELAFLDNLRITIDAELNMPFDFFWDLFFIPNLTTEDRNILKFTDPTKLDFHKLPLSESGNQRLLETSQALFRFLDLIKK